MALGTSHRPAAVALIGVTLAVALSGPPCAEPASCPMDQTQAAGACDGLSADCCQVAAERASGAPALPALAPAAAYSEVVSAPAAAREPEALARLADHPPPLAVVQGIGLHTLLSVFLI